MEGEPRQRANRRQTQTRGGVLLFLDSIVFCGSPLLALLVRFETPVPPEHLLPYLYVWPVLVLWRVFCAGAFDLYDFRRRLTFADFAFNACGAAAMAVLGGYVLLSTIQLYYLPNTQLSRVAAGADLVLLALWLSFSRWAVLAVRRMRGFRVHLLVLGPDGPCDALTDEIRAHAPKMLEVYTASSGEDTYAARFEYAAARRPIDQVVLTDAAMTQVELHDVLTKCEQRNADVYLLPGIDLSVLASARVSSIAGLPLVPLRPPILDSVYGSLKRMIDFTVSLLLLVVGAPFAAVVAAIIRLETNGRVFFLQERAGTNGRPYRIAKFRTMVENAEHRTGPVLSQPGDPRVTRVGKVLRRYRVDEWPQLWNVLMGEMSLVGPRPERPELIGPFIAENPLYERRFLVKPGLTGLAQIHGRYDSDYTHKLRYDLIYINSVSFVTDAQILLATVRTILTAHGAR